MTKIRISRIRKLSPLLRYYRYWRWPVLLMVQVLFRIPYYIHADKRMHGDEAFHWFLNYNNLYSDHFVLRPYNHEYLGITDFLFVLPFVPFTGMTALAHHLGLTVIYLLYVFVIVKFAENLFGKISGFVTWLLLLIPNPYLMILSAAYLGGHFGSIVLWLCGTFLLFEIYRRRFWKHWKPAVLFAGILWGLAYYTSELAIVGMVTASVLLLLISAFRLKNTKKSAVFMTLFFAGLFTGYIPGILAPYFEVVEPTWHQSARTPGFDHIAINLLIYLRFGLQAMSGLFSDGSLVTYGYRVGGSAGQILPFFNLVVLGLVVWFLPVKTVYNHLRSGRLFSARAVFLVFFCGITVANTIAYLSVDLNQGPFGIRYLFPAIAFVPVILASGFVMLAASKRKFLIAVPVLHFLFLWIGYAGGYTREEFHSFDGSEGADEILTYLNQNNLEASYASHWISYNLLYKSNLKHISSPAADISVVHYPPLKTQVDSMATDQPVALIQTIVFRDWFERHVIDDNARRLLILEADKVFEVEDEKQIGFWKILHLNQTAEDMSRRQKHSMFPVYFSWHWSQSIIRPVASNAHK